MTHGQVESVGCGKSPHDVPSLSDAFRSNMLPSLLEFLHSLSALKIVAKDLMKFHVVLDASAVQEHLRWLLGKRANPSATTSLHEAIVSGILIAFAPSYLESEIIEHQGEIATDTKRTAAEVWAHWLEMKKVLHLYPIDLLPEVAQQSVDPADEPYCFVRRQIGARAILTRDSHFMQMGEPVVMDHIDIALRDYARASTVRVGLVIGSGVVFSLSLGTIFEIFRMLESMVDWLRRQSSTVQIAIIGGILAIALHPKMRSKFIKVWHATASILKNATLEGVAIVATEITKADQIATTNLHTIEAAFPPAAKRTLVMHARAVSLMAKEPLSLSELAGRIKENGYCSRSSQRSKYLRRVLSKAPDFYQPLPGRWLFKPSMI